MGPKILVTILIIVSFFGLNQCFDRLHPIGMERCFHKFMGGGTPFELEFLCCVEDSSNCFPEYENENCIKCPPLRKGEAKSPSPSGAPAPL
ncbi:Uncharacterized protein HA466_0076440 [Hirschfeldia incana]|nr:Uncharacterized protein HA466_0076440 [Hirschfeldia incana]